MQPSSSDEQHEIELELDSAMHELQTLTAAVERFAEIHDWPMPLTFAFNLSLEEWVTNIIVYGYKEERGHPIRVILRQAETTAEAEVIDDSMPFSPLTDVQLPDLSSDVSERRMGGLGIHLMRQMMDELHYWKKGHFNHLRIVKNLEVSQ